MTEDEDPQRSSRQKRIASNTRVSGKFGEFIDNNLPGRRRHRARIYGTVVEAIDSRKYRVLFDNGQILECYSNSLKVEGEASLPPDLPPVSQSQQSYQRPQSGAPVQGSDAPAQDAQIPLAESDDASLEEHLSFHDPADDEISMTRESVEEEQMPVGALPTVEQVEAPSYHRRKADAKEKIRQMLGRTVREKSGNNTILWTVIEDHSPLNPINSRADDHPIGFKDIERIKKVSKNKVLAELFLELMFKDKSHLKEKVQQMNDYIKAERSSKIKFFSSEEFVICLGLFIGSAEFESQGKKCWISGDHPSYEDEEDFTFHSLVQHPNIDRYISFHRFKDFCRFLPSIWWDEEKRTAGDPWWQLTSAVSNSKA